ncbi:hypothetical protein [Candidatus Foliamicus sp.]
MKFFAFSVPSDGATDANRRRRKTPDVYRAWKLYQRGVLREMYWRKDNQEGLILVLECDSTDKATAALNSMQREGDDKLDFEIIPVGPYDHWDRLFKEEFA